MKLRYVCVMHYYYLCAPIILRGNNVRGWEKDILWVPDGGEVAINLVGEAQFAIFCWCIFMLHIYLCMDILAVRALGIMWKIPYYWCMCMSVEMTIIITALEIDVNGKLMSCVILISFHRVVVYSILIIHAFDSISQCFINILAEPCGLPYLLSCHSR